MKGGARIGAAKKREKIRPNYNPETVMYNVRRYV